MSAEEPEELKRFREQWKAEVQRKRQEQTAHSPTEPSITSATPSTSTHIESTPAHDDHPVKLSDLVEPTSSGVNYATTGTAGVRRKAVDVYREAVRCEQASKLDEALRLYRQAFRMDSNVDRAYHYAEQQANGTSKKSTLHKKTTSTDAQVDALANGVAAVKVSDVPHTPRIFDSSHVIENGAGNITGTLAGVLKEFPESLGFEPAEEKEPLHLAKLPNELLTHVLRFLNITSLERFAQVNRKARILTLDSTYWRRLVLATYKPPQIKEDERIEDTINEFQKDYRRLFIEKPRVRLDGVYIAVCHYTRHGMSDNAWVAISHLITYHRYLRFFPMGDVISLLANEEYNPQQIIPILKPTLRMKGLYIGRWALSGHNLFITDLRDPSRSDAKYTFQMTLTLRSRPLGRWNKIDFDGYDSVDVGTGEACPLPLKNERPFWFSKVRSYASGNE